MSKNNKVIIIGGGASGLVAAIYASISNDVTILEKNSKCGKKILATGNGKCNYFNSDFTSVHFNTESIDILETIISDKNKNKVMDFFNSIGIVPNIKNGYYYPMSNQAISVREALVKECEVRGVKIINDCEVIDVNYNNSYEVITSLGNYSCDKLVISTGSNAWIKDKSIGYDILSKFNHNINTVVPALVQLVGSGNFLKKWNGVRIDCNVSLFENNKLIKKSSGEVQLTDYGVSGICVFQLSSLVAKGLSQNKKEVIHINFLPWINDFISFMDNRNNILKDRTISELFDGIMNYKLSNTILDICNIDYNDTWESLSTDKKNELYKNLTDFELTIVDTKGFASAQTCSGGVSLNEINPNTMESIIKSDLYITGELLDCDGECGGYNLGFAWITGMIVGSSLNDTNKTD